MVSQPFDRTEFLATFLPLRHNGWTDPEIAARMNISVKALRNRATRCGVQPLPSPDMYCEDDLWDAANAMTVLVREEDPQAVFSGIAQLCATEPLKVAQVVLTLAAWVNVDEPMSAWSARVAAIAKSRARRRRVAV